MRLKHKIYSFKKNLKEKGFIFTFKQAVFFYLSLLPMQNLPKIRVVIERDFEDLTLEICGNKFPKRLV